MKLVLTVLLGASSNDITRRSKYRTKTSSSRFVHRKHGQVQIHSMLTYYVINVLQSDVDRV